MSNSMQQRSLPESNEGQCFNLKATRGPLKLINELITILKVSVSQLL